MRKSNKVTKKPPRGRPVTTGKGVQVGERWHAPELQAIDRWIADNGKMSRGEAIRRLVDLGLRRSRNEAR